MKTIKLYYQDCPDCGSRKEWAAAQNAIATANGIEIIKTSFIVDGAKEIIRAAAKEGVNLPFFYDGEKFAKDLAEFADGAKLSAESVANSCPVKKRGRKARKDPDGENN
jgi:hypothetical protein